MPQLEEQDLDLIGLGLLALATFFSFVFYFGWDGGKVGEALEKGFVYLFGGVGYLAPIAFFGAGAVLVLRQVLPSVRPFRAGAACLLSGLMLGLAAGSFGLGPSHPARHGYFKPEYFKHHGVRLEHSRLLQRGHAVLGEAHVIALEPQRAAQGAADLGVVLHHQYARPLCH